MSGPASVFSARPPDPGTAAPSPGHFESFWLKIDRDRVGEDWGLNQQSWEDRTLHEVEGELKKRGWQPPRTLPGDRSTFRLQRQQRILTTMLELERQRKGDPKLFPEMAGVIDEEDFNAYVARRRAAETAGIDGALDGGSTAGQLAGSFAAALLDPLSYIPVGGSAVKGAGALRQIVTVGAKEAAANVAVGVATEPLVQVDAARIGVDRGAGDVLTELGVGAVAGFAIGGAAKGAEIGVGNVVEAVRARRREAGTEADREAVEALRQAVPEENWTPQEREAVAVIERVADAAEASPFAPGASDEEHVARLNDTFKRMLTGSPPTARSAPKRVTRSELLSGTADPASFRMPAREQLKARIRQAESGGNDRAKNPLSSASGRYQFTMGTWLSYYKRRYGGKLSNNEIWAKRFDGNVQEVLMNDLVADNAAALREAGQPETAGSLYLLHFAGEAGGLKVLRAAPDAPVEQVLGAAVVAANPFLKGKNAGDVVAWADRKMGAPGATVARAGDAPAAKPEPDAETPELRYADGQARPEWPDEPEYPRLRPELFGTAEEHARVQVDLWRERDARDGFAWLVDDPPPPGPTIEVPAKKPRKRYGTPHLMQDIADAGGIVDNEGHDLVGGRNIPKFMLGVGAIIRPEGTRGARSIDALGEVLWEKGYFGPPETTPRPAVPEVLELIERGVRQKVYPPEQAAGAIERQAMRQRSAEEEDTRWELAETAREWGAELDEWTLEDALLRRARGEPVEDAIGDAIAAARFRDLPSAAGPFEATGPEAEGQLASIEHDLMMMMREDTARYQLDDGSEQTIAQFLKASDDEIGLAETLRGCMAPAREAAE